MEKEKGADREAVNRVEVRKAGLTKAAEEMEDRKKATENARDRAKADKQTTSLQLTVLRRESRKVLAQVRNAMEGQMWGEY